jgi:hypothetical protein
MPAAPVRARFLVGGDHPWSADVHWENGVARYREDRTRVVPEGAFQGSLFASGPDSGPGEPDGKGRAGDCSRYRWRDVGFSW